MVRTYVPTYGMVSLDDTVDPTSRSGMAMAIPINQSAILLPAQLLFNTAFSDIALVLYWRQDPPLGDPAHI